VLVISVPLALRPPRGTVQEHQSQKGLRKFIKSLCNFTAKSGYQAAADKMLK